jgi:hypothetical protein
MEIHLALKKTSYSTRRQYGTLISGIIVEWNRWLKMRAENPHLIIPPVRELLTFDVFKQYIDVWCEHGVLGGYLLISPEMMEFAHERQYDVFSSRSILLTPEFIEKYSYKKWDTRQLIENKMNLDPIYIFLNQP